MLTIPLISIQSASPWAINFSGKRNRRSQGRCETRDRQWLGDLYTGATVLETSQQAVEYQLSGALSVGFPGSAECIKIAEIANNRRMIYHDDDDSEWLTGVFPESNSKTGTGENLDEIAADSKGQP